MDKIQIYNVNLDNYANLYQHRELIGEGGYGKVYEGLAKKTGDSVAIKFVKKKKLSDSELSREFPREFELLREVQDVSGVIGLVDYFDLSDRYVYVMEKPNDCIDLDTFIDNHYNEYKKPLTEVTSKDIWKQLVETTIGCHEYKIYHRDIKPENILLDSDLKIRLIDFGCGDILKKGPYFEFAGTWQFNPPEVVKGNGAYFAEPQTVWTLGITLFQMVCGVLPFNTKEDICARNMAYYEESMFKKLSKKCQSTIRKCMRKNPCERPKLKDLLSLPWMIEEDDFDNIDSNNDSNQDMNLKIEMPSTKKRKHEDDSCKDTHIQTDLESGYTSNIHNAKKKKVDFDNINSDNDANDMNLKIEMPLTQKRKHDDSCKDTHIQTDLESGYTSNIHNAKKKEISGEQSDSTSVLKQDVKTDIKVEEALADLAEMDPIIHAFMVENFKFVNEMSAGDVCQTEIVQLSKEIQ